MTCFLFVAIFNSFAIAYAVSGWSPVIIIGFKPAVLHFSIAVFTSGRGGSIIPTRPEKIKSSSKSLKSLLTVLYANARTRSAFELISSLISVSFVMWLLFSFSTLPFIKIYLHFLIRLS